MSKYRNNSFLFTTSIVLFSSYPALPSLKLRALLISLFLLLQAIHFFMNKKRINETWFVILLTSPFLFYTLSLTYTDNLAEGLKSLERITFLFLGPLVLYLNRSYIYLKTFKLALNVFSVSGILLVLYSIVSLIYSGINPLSSDYFTVRTALEQFSRMHPTYFSLTISIAFLYLLSTLFLKENTTSKAVKISGLFIISTGLLVASSKMILAGTVLSSIYIVFKNLPKRNAALLALSGSVVLAVVIYSSDPLKIRITEFYRAISSESIEQNNPDSMRKVIFEGAVFAIKQQPFLGAGIGSQQELIDNYYLKQKQTLAFNKHFNAHNQYLQTWITAGIMSFILLILILITLITIGIILNNSLLASVGILFALSMFSESILTRQDGVFLFAFFPSFLVYAVWNKQIATSFINGRFTTQPLTGVQRYAQEISKCLLTNTNFRLIAPKNRNNQLSFIKGNFWEQIILPIRLKLTGSPLLLNLCNTAPIIYKNHITVIHDVAFLKNPNWFNSGFRTWYKFMLKFTIRNAKKLITVSNFSKREIVHFTGCHPDKIEITFNGVGDDFLTQKRTESIIPEGYALTVGSISERKQQVQIIETFLAHNDIPEKLVVAGSKNNLVFGRATTLTEKLNASDRIIFFENPTDEELANLYRNARFTIYISSYEGFGIPILESLLFKKPVIASSIPVFKELFEEYICYSKTSNVDELFKSIQTVNSNLKYWEGKASDFSQTNSYSFTLSSSKIVKIIENINSHGK